MEVMSQNKREMRQELELQSQAHTTLASSVGGARCAQQGAVVRVIVGAGRVIPAPIRKFTWVPIALGAPIRKFTWVPMALYAPMRKFTWVLEMIFRLHVCVQSIRLDTKTYRFQLSFVNLSQSEVLSKAEFLYRCVFYR